LRHQPMPLLSLETAASCG